jgi:DNA-directed RNA polymerase subunit RPC12/RpoP
MRGTIIKAGVDFEVEDCIRCGAVYALTKDFLERKLNKGGSWWCPYCGNKMHYCKSKIQKLEEQLRNANNSLARETSRHDQTKMSLRAHKAAKTRLKNRIGKGICPCCNRYFANLHNHIAKEHPEFVTE